MLLLWTFTGDSMVENLLHALPPKFHCSCMLRYPSFPPRAPIHHAMGHNGDTWTLLICWKNCCTCIKWSQQTCRPRLEFDPSQIKPRTNTASVFVTTTWIGIIERRSYHNNVITARRSSDTTKISIEELTWQTFLYGFLCLVCSYGTKNCILRSHRVWLVVYCEHPNSGPYNSLCSSVSGAHKQAPVVGSTGPFPYEKR